MFLLTMDQMTKCNVKGVALSTHRELSTVQIFSATRSCEVKHRAAFSQTLSPVVCGQQS